MMIESILRNKANSDFGWSKTNLPKPGRVIKIGNSRNCNDDGCYYDPSIENKIIDILKIREIFNFNIKKISTHFENSFELYLDEEAYQDLVKKL